MHTTLDLNDICELISFDVVAFPFDDAGPFEAVLWNCDALCSWADQPVGAMAVRIERTASSVELVLRCVTDDDAIGRFWSKLATWRIDGDARINARLLTIAVEAAVAFHDARD